MKIDANEIQKRLNYVGFTPEDKQRILSISNLVGQNVEGFVMVFFDFLKRFPEAKGVTDNKEVFDQAYRLKREHLLAMVKGDYGLPYVDERLKLGMLYAQAGLDIKVFVGAFHHLMRAIGFKVMEQGLADRFETFMSFKKLAFFDISLIVDTLIGERERIINLQQEAIRELSTPVLPIDEGLLLLPIVGTVDIDRARQMTENLLAAIHEHRAKVAVLDITGVADVDSSVAQHLTQLVEAAGLMGARTIITGLSANLACSLVHLGVDVKKLETMPDLRRGMQLAKELMAVRG